MKRLTIKESVLEYAARGTFLIPQCLEKMILHYFQTRRIRLLFQSDVLRIAEERCENADMKSIWRSKSDELRKEAVAYDHIDAPVARFVETHDEE